MTIGPKVSASYSTPLGKMFAGKAEDLFQAPAFAEYRGKIQLIFTSPPFPLNHKKRYGNLQGDAYRDWLADFAPRFSSLLSPTGSIVLEVGNVWEPGKPVMSTLALRSLLTFQERGQLHLCQQFVCVNPARLPSPAQWVTIERVRVKDSFTHLWWLSPVERPKADNRRVLKPYSPSMLQLLKSKKYNAGRRPSDHNVGKVSFLSNNAGAIPPNVLSFSNTMANDPYQAYCRKKGITAHPARMAPGVPEFFINLLTDPGDLVLDPFAGSNTTGATAERLGRRWLAIEPNPGYRKGSRGRFQLHSPPANPSPANHGGKI